jgi:hypothetical protein
MRLQGVAPGSCRQVRLAAEARAHMMFARNARAIVDDYGCAISLVPVRYLVVMEWSRTSASAAP